MVDYAASNGVRAIIIAGDLFDTQTQTQDQKFLADLISQTPQIDFYILKNHDGYDILTPLIPPNFQLFLDGVDDL